MRRIQIPTDMGLEEFALSYIEGERKGKACRPEEAKRAPGQVPEEARKAAWKRHKRVRYEEAEPELPQKPILKPALPVREEVEERALSPMMPPSSVPAPALPPMKPPPFPGMPKEVDVEPEMPMEPPLEEEVAERAAEEEVDAMVPQEMMGEEEEIVEDAFEEDKELPAPDLKTGTGVEPSTEERLRELTPFMQGCSCKYGSELGQQGGPGGPSLLPVFLLAAGIVVVGTIIYAVNHPEAFSTENN